jgi:hypothetical protein
VPCQLRIQRNEEWAPQVGSLGKKGSPIRLRFVALFGLAASLLISSTPALFGSDYVRTLSGDFSTTDWYKVDFAISLG